MVAKAPWEVQQKWMSVASKQEEARSKTGSFKNELKAIEQHVKNQPSVRAMYGGQVSGIGQLVIGELQAKFNRKVAEYIATGQVSPQEAASVAMKEVMSEFDNPTGRYAINSQGDFTNFKFGSAKTSKSLNLKLNKIRTALAYGGKGSLDNKPGLIFDAGELQAIEQGYGKPGFTMPAEAQYWGSKLGISPLEVINRQRRAAGMNELATPAAMEQIQGTISPQLQAILNRYQSYNRSVRALSSMGRFEPAAVPKGFGGTIQTAAKANGIDPAILAGLLEVESRWRDDVIYGKTRSKKGARGIAQIMPEYHPGVNYDDPNASINYAAKYLSSLQRQFGGDMRLALIAYNAGPGNVEKYRGPIPGDAESSSYYSNVIKSAAKYGYGRAWQDPATMRSKFASSITFDSGQPGIDVYFDDKNFTTVLPGRVKEVGNQTTAGGNGYGNYVVVESIDPLTQRPVDVLYAHLDSINVKEGQSLKAGSRIGRQGGTGRVVSQDGTIASIDFLAPAPKGSKSMAPYSGYEQLRRYIAKNLRQG
jgi:murein DD-endopeptidase MepM/ murein hydrolase activator NlpD